MMNKKGQYFVIGTVAIIIAGLIYAYIGITGSLSGVDAKTSIGSYEGDLLRTYQASDQALDYLDASASIAAHKALWEAYASSEESTACGAYAYAAWNGPDTSCLPDPAQDLPPYVDKELNSLISAYPDLVLPFNNYRWVLQQHQADFGLVGFAKKPVSVIITHGKAPSVLGSGQGLLGDDICGMTNLEPIDTTRVACLNNNCLLQPEALERLYAVQDALHAWGSDVTLIVTSSYRSYAQQKELYDACAPDCNGKVAEPTCSAPHVQGLAVDVMVNSPEFDTGPISLTVNKVYSNEEIANQQVLGEIMCSQGWVNYQKEWWHFEYHTRRWERAQNQDGTMQCSIV